MLCNVVVVVVVVDDDDDDVLNLISLLSLPHSLALSSWGIRLS